MAIPEEIKRHRPTCTEIHKRGDNYYVYKITSVWDKEKKRPKKKTGACIGKIIAGVGFVESKKRSAHLVQPADPVRVVDFGLYSLFSALEPTLLDELKTHLGSDMGSLCYALSMMRLSGKTVAAHASRTYRFSWLSEKIGPLSMSETSLTKKLRELGSMRDEIEAFMSSRMPKETTLLFDGSLFLCSSTGIESARFGRGGKREVSLMLIFDRDAHRPAWYRLLPGNIADVSAFELTLRQSRAHSCTVVADKGFYSKKNVGALDRSSLSYVLPLRSNTTLIDTSFLDLDTTDVYDGLFEYHNRCIFYKSVELIAKEKRVIVFRDEGMRSTRLATFARKLREEGEETTDPGELKKQRRTLGITLLYTNLGESPEEVFLTYKDRWVIEEAFDYLKNGLDLGRIYQRTQEQAEAWAFLNHLSMTLFYALYHTIRLRWNDLPSRWRSPEAFIEAAKCIYKVKIGDGWHLSEISKPDLDIFARIGVSFDL